MKCAPGCVLTSVTHIVNLEKIWKIFISQPKNNKNPHEDPNSFLGETFDFLWLSSYCHGWFLRWRHGQERRFDLNISLQSWDLRFKMSDKFQPVKCTEFGQEFVNNAESSGGSLNIQFWVSPPPARENLSESVSSSYTNIWVKDDRIWGLFISCIEK